MLELRKLCLNFYSLCFSFHFLFFFSLYVVNAFMRALMLFDPLMGEVPQITLPCCLSRISTSRSPGSCDLLEAVRGMSSSGLCFLQMRGITWDWVGRKIALQSPLAFSRPLERASWVMHTVNDLLAVFARRKTSLLCSMWADITRCFCQAPANTQNRCHNFPFQLIFLSRWKLEADCHSWLSPPCLTLQPAEVLVILLLRLAAQHWPQDAYILTVLLHESIIQEILNYIFPALVCWLSSLQLESLLCHRITEC